MELEYVHGRVDRLLRQLVHNGIVIPEPPEPVGLTITVRGKPVALTPKQEEMAIALGAAGYLQKPVTRRGFLDALDALLDPPATGSR